MLIIDHSGLLYKWTHFANHTTFYFTPLCIYLRNWGLSLLFPWCHAFKQLRKSFANRNPIHVDRWTHLSIRLPCVSVSIPSSLKHKILFDIKLWCFSDCKTHQVPIFAKFHFTISQALLNTTYSSWLRLSFTHKGFAVHFLDIIFTYFKDLWGEQYFKVRRTAIRMRTNVDDLYVGLFFLKPILSRESRALLSRV